MLRRLSGLLPIIVAILAVAPLPLAGQALGQVSYERFTLANGLDVVLAPDPSTDVVAIDVWYFTGTRDETPTAPGVARLFDRLMFAGSAHVPPGGHATMIEVAGGRVSATIDEDVSRFGEAVPASLLPQALWLEAERMRGILVNDTTVNQSRAGLLADTRERLVREPYSAVILQSVAALYDSTSCPAYNHSPISRSLNTTPISTATARGFFTLFYKPNNARLVVAGNFEPATARRLVQEYFGGIERGREVVRARCTGEAARIPPRREITDGSVARAAAGLFFRVPEPTHRDWPALELLGVVLGQGTGGRLATALVRESASASSIQAGLFGDRAGPGAFGLFAVAAQGVKGDSLVKLLTAQAAWAGASLDEASLERAKNIYRATSASRRERPQDLAVELQRAATFRGRIESVNTDIDDVLGLTVADLRRVAAAWLLPQNALTVTVVPGGAS